MKKRSLFGFLFKTEKPERVPAYGISAREYHSIKTSIENAYQAAAERQRPDTKEPSAYMKGLQTALELLKMYTPHCLEVHK